MNKLNESLILQIHDEQIEKWGGICGIRDLELFKSQCLMPYQTFYGEDLFPDIYDKAVRYLFGFAGNQVFIDGNKRTAVMTMLVFLAVNGVELDIDEYGLYGLAMSVANHETDEETVKNYLIQHTV